MGTDTYITIQQLAKLLGVSRIAIFKRVKKGQIPAVKIGKTYMITDKTVNEILGKEVSQKGKERIDSAVIRTVREYGELLKLLGKE